MSTALRTAPVHVRVPASSANLGPGFDAVGLALALRDDVTVQVRSPGPSSHDQPGITVEVAGEGEEDVPRDAQHLVVRAIAAGLEAMDVAFPATLHVSCRNRIPHCRGLGSSAAAVVAGIVAARALVSDPERRLDDAACLALATRFEGHPDNVAACLLGGFTVAWQEEHAEEGVDRPQARAVRLTPAAGLGAVVFVPNRGVPTAHARRVLPASVPHADAAHAAGRCALLVEAVTRRPELLLAATQDRLHQRYRAAAMPATCELIARLRAQGVPAVLSGAGPTVLALSSGTPTSPSATPLTAKAPAGFTAVELALDLDGATSRVDC